MSTPPTQAFWIIYRHCRSSQNMMTHHPLTKWKRPFSLTKTTKQPVQTTPQMLSLSMVNVCFLRNLHNFIIGCWSAKCLRQQWKNANIILVRKPKGDRAECCNSCGISLPTVAGWVLGQIMHTCLLEYVVDHVMPESQCEFRRGRSTIDMIFVARREQEKCHEQHQDICMAFVDLTKAFDTVIRDLLWNNLAALPR